MLEATENARREDPHKARLDVEVLAGTPARERALTEAVRAGGGAAIEAVHAIDAGKVLKTAEQQAARMRRGGTEPATTWSPPQTTSRLLVADAASVDIDRACDALRITSGNKVIVAADGTEAELDAERLFGNAERQADLAVRLEQVADPRLWDENAPGGATQLRPAYWPSLIHWPARRTQQLAQLASERDTRVAAVLGWPSEAEEAASRDLVSGLSACRRQMRDINWTTMFETGCRIGTQAERRRIRTAATRGRPKEYYAARLAMLWCSSWWLDRWVRLHALSADGPLVELPEQIAARPAQFKVKNAEDATARATEPWPQALKPADWYPRPTAARTIVDGTAETAETAETAGKERPQKFGWCVARSVFVATDTLRFRIWPAGSRQARPASLHTHGCLPHARVETARGQ